MLSTEMEYEPSKPRLSRTSRTTDPEMFANAIRGAELQPCQLGDPAPSSYARLDCPRVSLDLASLGTAVSFSGKASPDCYTLAFATACPRTGVSLTFGVEHTEGLKDGDPVLPPGIVLDERNNACTNGRAR